MTELRSFIWSYGLHYQDLKDPSSRQNFDDTLALTLNLNIALSHSMVKKVHKIWWVTKFGDDFDDKFGDSQFF